jgi:hypothetical protein
MIRASTFTHRYRAWLRPFLRMCGTLMRAQAPHVPPRPALPRSEALSTPSAADLLPDTQSCISYAFPTPLAFLRPPQRRRSARKKKRRDAARRRVRHRDSALPCGGPDLATGLGWDGWEDEDAPSPFGCCLAAVKLVQRAPAPRRAMRRCPLGRVGADAGAGGLALSTLSAASGVSRAPASPRALCKTANVRGGRAPRRPSRSHAPRARDGAGGRAGARGQQRLATRGDHAPVREEERCREPRARARAVRIEPARALAGAIRTEPEYMRAALGAPVGELVRILAGGL